jgi:iron(III) transport system substrate-binding protein
VVANFARSPNGGDTDQITAVAAGECGVAIVNTYYYARLLASEKPDDRKLMGSVALVWPNQKSFGTHLNVSGAGVLKSAPHKDAAIQYLEYLASDAAQSYFASGNNEWPAVAGAPLNNRTLESMGTFKADTLNVSALGKNQPAAQKVFDRAGFR